MNLITDIAENDRTYNYYYASYHTDNEGDIETNSCPEDVEECGIDGYTVYEQQPDQTWQAISDATDEQFAKFLTMRLINKELAAYSLNEVVADIMMQVCYRKYRTETSRALIDDVISWAQEFETLHIATKWDIDADYIDEIEKFTELKINEALAKKIGFIDNDQN